MPRFFQHQRILPKLQVQMYLHLHSRSFRIIFILDQTRMFKFWTIPDFPHSGHSSISVYMFLFQKLDVCIHMPLELPLLTLPLCTVDWFAKTQKA